MFDYINVSTHKSLHFIEFTITRRLNTYSEYGGIQSLYIISGDTDIKCWTKSRLLKKTNKLPSDHIYSIQNTGQKFVILKITLDAITPTVFDIELEQKLIIK